MTLRLKLLALVVVCVVVFGGGVAVGRSTAPDAHHVEARHIPPGAASCFGSAKTQWAMDQCAAHALTLANRELSHALDAQRQVLPRTLVDPAQRRWVSFATEECAAEEAPYAGGSIQPMIYDLCLGDLTTHRIAEVEADTASLKH